MDILCQICNNPSPFRVNRDGTDYYQCSSCKTLFCNALDNSNMVGGGNEIERNEVQNQKRIQRLIARLGLKEGMSVLDFGCGHGMLVKDIRDAEYVADGYDAFNDNFKMLPERNKYSIVTMVEVIEHLSQPFIELDCIHRSLCSGGYVYIETSFVDIAKEENISLEDFFYIEPSVGHSTIFSHHGLDVLMCIKGFIPIAHIDRNTRLYVKK